MKKIAQGRLRRQQRQLDAAERQLDATTRRLAVAKRIAVAAASDGTGRYPAEDVAAVKAAALRRVDLLTARHAQDEARLARLRAGDYPQ